MPDLIVYQSILDHPLWDHWGLYCIWKYLRPRQSKKYGHWRRELDPRIPPAFLDELRIIQVRCRSCGDAYHPINKRKEDERYSGYYFNISCERESEEHKKRGCGHKDPCRDEASRVQTALLRLWRIPGATARVLPAPTSEVSP